MTRIDSPIAPKPSDIELPATRPITVIGWIPDDPDDSDETA